MWHFSPSRHGFFHEGDKPIYERSAHGWPTDTIMVTDVEYQTYVTATPPLHHRLGVDTMSGKLGWVPWSEDEVQQNEALRAEDARVRAKAKCDEFQTLAVVRGLSPEEQADSEYYSQAWVQLYDDPSNLEVVQAIFDRLNA